ncbi:hypothetical protein C0J52_22247 [Blattella germanica]|nr:hypothetical protein C0J52_22247 [Blattella germanica]
MTISQQSYQMVYAYILHPHSIMLKIRIGALGIILYIQTSSSEGAQELGTEGMKNIIRLSDFFRRNNLQRVTVYQPTIDRSVTYVLGHGSETPSNQKEEMSGLPTNKLVFLIGICYISQLSTFLMMLDIH